LLSRLLGIVLRHHPNILIFAHLDIIARALQEQVMD
jgi:hypothetical protein